MRALTRLPAMRARQEGRFTDTCKITAPGTGTRGPLNPGTGQYDATPARVTVYEGPCQFDIGGGLLGNTTQASAGEATVDIADSLLKLPAGAASADVRVNHIAECLTSDDDESLPGRNFGLVAVPTSSQKTARRCRIREVVAT